MESLFELLHKGNIKAETLAVAALVIVIIPFLFSFYSVLAGKAFWGKKSEKIGVFEYPCDDGKEIITIYKLSGKSGYKGFGLKFFTSRITEHGLDKDHERSWSTVEFTAGEILQLSQLIENNKGK